MKTNYQKGKEPTAAEMVNMAKSYTPKQWEVLISNETFVQNFDKDLNLMAIAAEMILNNRRVLNLNDVKARISS
jgi:hypothetical protein|tara:strand:- start:5063 stop:5284 length:222 start_codon:yes stop_codon:yes gene_type:complete